MLPLYDVIYNVILASGLEGLRRKPTLVIHFLVALFLAGVGVMLSKWVMTGLLGCALCFPNYQLLLILTLILVLISLGWYATFWHRLEEHMRELLPQALGSALKDYYSFSQMIMNSTLYDLIDKEELKKAIPSIITLLLSYYSAWVFSLYSFDLALYVLSDGKYTVFGYLTQHALMSIILPLILSLILSLIIRPWSNNREHQDKVETKDNTTPTPQYLYSILRIFRSYRGSGISSKIASKWWGRIAISCLENLFSLPPMMSPRGLIITDFHQVPYTSDIEKKIKEMLRRNTTGNYVLEPLEERCKDPPKAEVPLLSKACWYRVKHIVRGEHGIEKGTKVIGYVMMLILTKKEERIDPEIFRDCLKKLRKNVRRNCQNIAQQLIKDFKKLYLEREEIMLLFLLGNEKLLGLKITLS